MKGRGKSCALRHRRCTANWWSSAINPGCPPLPVCWKVMPWRWYWWTRCISPDRVICWSYSLRKARSEEHTSELQSRENVVCRLLLEKKKNNMPYLQPSSSVCAPSATPHVHPPSLHDALPISPALYSELVVKRNKSWLPAFAGMLKSDAVEMVLVDAMHFTGPGNLLELFAAEG